MENYAGVVERDGWAPYRRFTRARHQSCLAHLLRRCRELISDADRGQARTPHAVRRILTHALAVRADRDHGALTAADATVEAIVDAIVEATVEAERLGGAVDRLITDSSPTHHRAQRPPAQPAAAEPPGP